MTRDWVHRHRVAALLALPLVAGWAAGVPTTDDSRLARATALCKSAVLIACGEALAGKPNDPDLLVAEGDALVQLRRPGEGIGVYRNALHHAARPELVEHKIATAQAVRESLLQVCITQEGDTAEHACESAWLPGAPDEVTVFKRRGLLLESAGHRSAALDAYMAAARLKPRDRSVAHAIIGLSGPAGRRDAPAMLGRGVAFMNLGHPADALTALREAVSLAPDSAEARSQLRRAEHLIPVASAASAAASGPEPRDEAAEIRSDVRDASIGPYTNEAERTRSN